jgi:hypothetical protein
MSFHVAWVFMVSKLKNAREKYAKRDLTCSFRGPFNYDTPNQVIFFILLFLLLYADFFVILFKNKSSMFYLKVRTKFHTHTRSLKASLSSPVIIRRHSAAPSLSCQVAMWNTPSLMFANPKLAQQVKG